LNKTIKCKVCKEYTIKEYTFKDICLECIDIIEYPQDYRLNADFKDMIMTYSDKVLGENK
jgi:rRNA maturation protein Nop10